MGKEPPADMHILGPDVSAGEKLVRPAVVYGFLLASVRDIRHAFLEGDGHVSVIAGRPRRE